MVRTVLCELERAEQEYTSSTFENGEIIFVKETVGLLKMPWQLCQISVEGSALRVLLLVSSSPQLRVFSQNYQKVQSFC